MSCGAAISRCVPCLQYSVPILTLSPQVTNLTPLELIELKPFLVKAMTMMQALEPQSTSQDEDLGDDSQYQSIDTQ